MKEKKGEGRRRKEKKGEGMRFFEVSKFGFIKVRHHG